MPGHTSSKKIWSPEQKKSESSGVLKWKYLKNYWSQIWHDEKKLARTPLWQIQSRELSKRKNSENFLTWNFVSPKKFGAWIPLWKIQSPECLVNKKIPKNFLTSNLVWPKNVGPDLPLKNSESRVLVKWKNTEKFFDLKFEKIFWPKIWNAQKSWSPHPPSEKFRVQFAR